ncbi:MAG TPA: Ig-like domain-containing protein, partial [Longimicrobium sp.]
MQRSVSSTRRLAFAAVSALALAACDRGEAPTLPGPQPAPPAAMVGSIRCTAAPRAGTLSCDRADLPSQARGYIIVGGQNQYVHLGSSEVSYNRSTQVFSFSATVQNLIPQPMGTTDGVTADSGGVKVIFSSGPTVTAGTGTASVTGDGSGTFTAAGQPFYKYAGGLLGGDGILSQNETSGARSWQLRVDSTVVSFSFLVYVVAEVPHPNGYVDVTPAADSLTVGSTQALTATVRSAVGNPISGQTVAWGTSDAGLATVDQNGNVTAVAPGMVTITATSGTRSGSATLAICPGLAVGGVFVADMPAGSSLCLGGGAAGAEFTAVPVNATDVAAVPISATGTGIVAASG